MDFPLAYLLTWTTYGTWLSGDRRTSVTHHNNKPGTPYSPADAVVTAAVRATMKHDPLYLSLDMRGCVDRTIRDHCEYRQWKLHAVNARSNHVHAVLSAALEPESVMAQLKAWSTRRLREASFVEIDRQVWTKHGSTRYLWDDKAIHDASRYVRDGQ